MLNLLQAMPQNLFFNVNIHEASVFHSRKQSNIFTCGLNQFDVLTMMNQLWTSLGSFFVYQGHKVLSLCVTGLLSDDLARHLSPCGSPCGAPFFWQAFSLDSLQEFLQIGTPTLFLSMIASALHKNNKTNLKNLLVTNTLAYSFHGGEKLSSYWSPNIKVMKLSFFQYVPCKALSLP